MKPASLISVGLAAAVSKVGNAASALWTFPSIIGAAMLIAWAAEAAQFLISQGMALALLAWLQTLPEFAVEAVIAWDAGKNIERSHLMIANLTGSLRLLVGLGWPLIFFTAAFSHRRKHGRFLREIELDREHSVEVVGLIVPIAFFFYIWAKGTLTLLDALVLIAIYLAYLFILNKIPPQGEEKMEELEAVPRRIVRSRHRGLIITGLFVGGGLVLYLVAHPFLESMLALALMFGISEFIFVQWVAPFLSEFPEKVSAFYWASRIRPAAMALMNMVSSNINQWTVLAAMLPIVFSISRGAVGSIAFDRLQESEILLTLGQSLLGVALLANMRFAWYEALALFSLWFIQFVRHTTREEVTVIYFGWFAVEVLLALVGRRPFSALEIFPRLIREHWSRPATAPRSALPDGTARKKP